MPTDKNPLFTTTEIRQCAQRLPAVEFLLAGLMDKQQVGFRHVSETTPQCEVSSAALP